MTTPTLPPAALTLPVWNIGEWAGNAWDEFGVAWTVTAEDGWSSRPAPRSQDTERIRDDGDIGSFQTYSARIITLTGTADAPNPIAMMLAREKFLAQGAILNSPLTLIAEERHLTRRATVKVSDEWKCTDKGSHISFDFQAVVKADDPLKYEEQDTLTVLTLPTAPETQGDIFSPEYRPDYVGRHGWPHPWPLPWSFVQMVGGTGTVFNRGNYPMKPVFEITGPVAQPRIENITTGEAIDLNLSIGEGETLTIDVKNRRVFVGQGASRSGSIKKYSQFPRIYPNPVAPNGLNTFRFSAAAYSASTCIIHSSSAWI